VWSGPRLRDVDGSIPGVERLLALSDGVVAIALTLLVLQLGVPHITDQQSWRELLRALWDQSALFTSYIVAFYVIAQFWLTHHRIFRMMRGHDESLAWWNFGFLFTITLFPFSAALIGAYPGNATAIDVFAINLLLASVATTLIGEIGRRHGLIRDDVATHVVRNGRIRGLAVEAVIVASIVVSWYAPAKAAYVWFLIAVVPALALRWFGTPPGSESDQRPGPEPGPGMVADAPRPGPAVE
jgi:uncharacterized membrane protein